MFERERFYDGGLFRLPPKHNQYKSFDNANLSSYNTGIVFSKSARLLNNKQCGWQRFQLILPNYKKYLYPVEVEIK